MSYCLRILNGQCSPLGTKKISPVCICSNICYLNILKPAICSCSELGYSKFRNYIYPLYIFSIDFLLSDSVLLHYHIFYRILVIMIAMLLLKSELVVWLNHAVILLPTPRCPSIFPCMIRCVRIVHYMSKEESLLILIVRTISFPLLICSMTS